MYEIVQYFRIFVYIFNNIQILNLRNFFDRKKNICFNIEIKMRRQRT